ncbi:hypothetical protein [Rhodovulum kholense]|uniref:hypothetical protein n=1 Tax=Rhodovulum kholense TaxID=453584 RepID=UPI000D39B86E|nr:hypothetical protein [Rhodovulum kholense]
MTEAAADLATDIARPFPAIGTTRDAQPVAPDSDAGKAVRIEMHPGRSRDAAAVPALQAANRGRGFW